jgi:hypothetical protein
MLHGRRIYRETGRTARPILVWCDRDLVVCTCPLGGTTVRRNRAHVSGAGRNGKVYMVYTYMRFFR